MKKFYEAADLIEARLLADYLADHRIETRVFGGALSGAAGELPADIRPAVWLLDDRDARLAHSLLTDWRQQGNARPAWQCLQCGECSPGSFDFCWHCGAPRPVDANHD